MIKLIDLTFQHHEQMKLGRLILKPVQFDDGTCVEYETPYEALSELSSGLLDIYLERIGFKARRACCTESAQDKKARYCSGCGRKLDEDWCMDEFINWLVELPGKDLNHLGRLVENIDFEFVVNPEDYVGLQREEIVWVPGDAELFLAGALSPDTLDPLLRDAVKEWWAQNPDVIQSEDPDGGRQEFMRNLNAGNLVAALVFVR